MSALRRHALLAFLVVSGGCAAASEDVIHLKTGEVIAGTIEALTDNIVTFTFRVGNGAAAGSAKRTIQAGQVAHVEFGFEAGEEEALRRRDTLASAELEKWWDFHFAHLHRPRSRTAVWGIALGNALLREGEESEAREALALFDRIAGRAWSQKDVDLAKQGRLRALIALGDLDTAMGEAQLLAGQTEDPELLIEVKHLLADADFAALQNLEEENPRWNEDDEVRPERNALYHRILDQYLWPHLFHATREDAAARGLLSAGKVYEFSGRTEAAIRAYRDLVTLYPGTESVATADSRIEALSPTRDPSSEEKP